MEKVWIIGDDFGFHSFQKYYYKQHKSDRYMIEEFEVSGFHNDSKASYDVNTISRFRNCFVGAIKDQAILPKYVVIVPDNNIIKFFFHYYQKSQKGYYGSSIQNKTCKNP